MAPINSAFITLTFVCSKPWRNSLPSLSSLFSKFQSFLAFSVMLFYYMFHVWVRFAVRPCFQRQKIREFLFGIGKCSVICSYIFPLRMAQKTAGAYRNSKYRLNLNSQCTCSKAHMSSVYSIGHFNSITTKNEAAHKESKLHKCKAIDKSNVQRVKNLNWRKNKFPLNL